MRGDRCGRCRFWPQYPYAEINGIPDAGDAGNGESDCRLRAPAAFQEPAYFGGSQPAPLEIRARWPRTRSSDWCGEFEVWDGLKQESR
jgi:hypothetical protein